MDSGVGGGEVEEERAGKVLWGKRGTWEVTGGG